MSPEVILFNQYFHHKLLQCEIFTLSHASDCSQSLLRGHVNMKMAEQRLQDIEIHLLEQLPHVVLPVDCAHLLTGDLLEGLAEMLLAHFVEERDALVETLVFYDCCLLFTCIDYVQVVPQLINAFLQCIFERLYVFSSIRQ